MTIKHGLHSLGLMHAGRLVFQHLKPTPSRVSFIRQLKSWCTRRLYLYEDELVFYCMIDSTSVISISMGYT